MKRSILAAMLAAIASGGTFANSPGSGSNNSHAIEEITIVGSRENARVLPGS